MTHDHSVAENPTRVFYDRISQRYDALADAWEHTSREKGVEALAVGAGEEVLEIGFGTGHALEQLAQAKARVVGLDLSEGMRSVAAQRIATAGLSARVRMDLGDARALPYEDDRFDAVFMSFTLELFQDDEIPRVVAEAKRVLRSGGRLGIVCLAKKHPPSLMTKIYSWLHEHFPHLADCHPIDAASHLTGAGFLIRETLVMSIWGLPVVSMVAIKPDGAWY